MGKGVEGLAMFKTRALARLAMAVLAATACLILVAGESVARRAVHADAATSPITISLKSSLKEGNLVVLLDDVPIFNEKFEKSAMAVSQTTKWDPLEVESGPHSLTAKVYGAKKNYVSPTYKLDVSATKASELRFVIKDDKLTAEVGS
jgi:hypothetical protein